MTTSNDSSFCTNTSAGEAKISFSSKNPLFIGLKLDCMTQVPKVNETVKITSYCPKEKMKGTVKRIKTITAGPIAIVRLYKVPSMPLAVAWGQAR